MALISSVSGELGGELGLLTTTPSRPPLSPASGLETEPDDTPDELAETEAKAPNELDAKSVPFLGGRPILFPVLENLVVLPPLVGLTGPSFGEITDDEAAADIDPDDPGLLVSILRGLTTIPDAEVEPPLMGIILAGESFRWGCMGGIGASLKLLSLALKS